MNRIAARRAEEDNDIPGLISVQQQDDTYYVEPLAHKHHFFLTGEITAPKDYLKWYRIINQAGPYDQIYIHINSYGGDMAAITQMVASIENSSANVIGSVEGECYSAAFNLFVKCDAWEIASDTSFLAHQYSGGVSGKAQELQANVEYSKKWSEKLYRDYYKDILTESEFLQMFDGKDIYLNGDEVTERLKRKVKNAEAKEKAETKKLKALSKAEKALEVLE